MVCKSCNKGKLKIIRAVEFGHIFKYDHFYTTHHDGFYIDKDGSQKLMYMGAYGIGIERAMAILVESHHDAKGIIWPKIVAPYQVHLIEIKRSAQDIYEKLEKTGIEVLWDETNSSAGGKICQYRSDWDSSETSGI